MSGKRRRGLRIVVPPGAVCMPTRVTCRLVRTDRPRGRRLPPLGDGDGLAIRGLLEMGPVGEQFSRWAEPTVFDYIIIVIINNIFMKGNDNEFKMIVCQENCD